MTQRCLALLFAVALTLTASLSRVEAADSKSDLTSGEVAVDLLLQRPVGLVATAVGTAIFLVGLPFTLANGSTEQAAHQLIVEPAQYTFTRPLGRNQ